MPQWHYLAAAVLAVGLVVVMISLRRQSRASNTYAISDLLLGDDGKASPSRHVLFGSFLIASWVVVSAALRDKLSDGIFTAYLAAFVAPAVSVIFAKKAPTP